MRIGAVSYLNTKPLVHGLAELAPRQAIVFDLPSRLADQLAIGEFDVALIPSIEYFQNPNYQIVSDACIACRGPVRSVKLFSRVPLDSIRTLALDEGSRTSAALVQILLAEHFGVRPEIVPFPIDSPPEAIDADALLMIGDRAMQRPSGSFVSEWDLGDVWCRWAELPFVFAMWVARVGSGRYSGESTRGVRGSGGEALAELSTTLNQARNLGVANIEAIAEREHAAVGLTYGECLTYLRDHLHFQLGPRELAGLELFRQHAVRLGLAPDSVPAKSNIGMELAGTKLGPGASKKWQTS
jgi:chorismate dehydratase